MSENHFAKPDTWGSSCWIFLHCVANTYPISPTALEKKQYMQFFNSLKQVLPCKICRIHYAEWLKSESIQYHLQNRESLKKWLFMLHNYINTRLQKKLLRNCDEGDLKILEYTKKKINQVRECYWIL